MKRTEMKRKTAAVLTRRRRTSEENVSKELSLEASRAELAVTWVEG